MIALDTGPLIAILDKDDRNHGVCVERLRQIREPLATTAMVLTEAAYMLSDVPGACDRLMDMWASGSFLVLPMDASDAARLRALIAKYRDLPMDLADASVVRLCEREAIGTIFTLDRRDFSVYRLHGRIRPTLIP